MNSNQLIILQKFVEKNAWKEFADYLGNELSHLSFQKKIDEINLLQAQFSKVKQSLRKNIMKWAIFSMKNSWTIEENKTEVLNFFIDSYIDYAHPEQIITIFKYFLEEKKIGYAQKTLAKFWSFSPCLHFKEDPAKIVHILKLMNNPQHTAQAIYFSIEIGHQELTQKAYELFYKQYFDLYDLEDEICVLWENLWNKMQSITEKWFVWDMLKLDVSLITDIIIKNKTGLQIPHYRKKREIAQAVIFLKNCQTLASTLLKYFHNIGNSDTVLEWIKFLENKKIVLDKDSQLIAQYYKIQKPKTVPKIVTSKAEDLNETQIFEDSLSDESEDYTVIKQKLDSIVPPKQYSTIDNEVLTDNLDWQERISVLSMEKDYKGVLQLIVENRDKILPQEKMDYDIFEMETMIKIGKYSEVLEKLENAWKGVQELEIFKVLKYLEGDSLWMLNRKREAIDCFRKVVEIDPSYKLAKWRLIENSL